VFTIGKNEPNPPGKDPVSKLSLRPGRTLLQAKLNSWGKDPVSKLYEREYKNAFILKNSGGIVPVKYVRNESMRSTNPT
jgi:hypothetical protein